MVEVLTRPMLTGHWKLTDEQYLFCSRLFNLYRLQTGHKFDKRLRGWLFFNQKTWMPAADFLAFLSLFDICADCAETHGIDCGTPCQDLKVCLGIYDIISTHSDYLPRKIDGSDSSYFPEPPILYGPVAELLRFLDSFEL